MRNLKYLVLFLGTLCFLMKPCFSEIYGTVSGKVISEETGIGIKGVNVIIYLSLGRRVGEGKTNDRGEFVINNISPGVCGITFEPPSPYAWDKIDYAGHDEGYSFPKGMQKIIVEEGKNLRIIKKCKIGGILEVRTFEKNTNIPIQGVEVYFNFRQHNYKLTMRNDRYTDSQGFYRLDRLAGGKFNIYLKKEGLWWKEIKAVEIQYNQTTRLDISYEIESQTKITGRVTCQQSGVPLKDILISIVSEDTIGWEYCYTDENGLFSMLDMVPGNYHISIYGSKETGEEVRIEKKFLVVKDHPITLNFSLDCDLNYDKRGDEI